MRAVITAATRALARGLCLTALLAAPLSAQAQTAEPWRPIARQCADEINARFSCASCAGLWPYWSICTVQRVYGSAVPQQTVSDCINHVSAAYTGKSLAYGDRVGDVMRCVAGGH
jgi:hypothetical protein